MIWLDIVLCPLLLLYCISSFLRISFIGGRALTKSVAIDMQGTLVAKGNTDFFEERTKILISACTFLVEFENSVFLDDDRFSCYAYAGIICFAVIDVLMKLVINKRAYTIMLAHCQSEYPLEACGFLGGQDEIAFVVTVIENRLSSPVAYEMDPRQQIEAMLNMENSNLDLMAAYHSHPNGPSRPSPTDLAKAYSPDLPQIIVSLRERSSPSVGVFLLTPDSVQELKLEPV